jgi:hypothetical protein
MTTDPNKSEISMEELSGVAGGSKNSDNAVVKTVLDAFNKAIKPDPTELVRSSGCLGATDNRFGHT